MIRLSRRLKPMLDAPMLVDSPSRREPKLDSESRATIGPSSLAPRASRLLIPLALCAIFATTSATPLRAQDPFADPFQPDAEKGKEQPEEPKPDGEDAEATEAAYRDPAVQAMLSQPQETPAQKLRVLTTLADLGYPRVAAPLLARLIEANLSDEALAELVEQFGSAVFLRLAHHRQLAPEAAEFADAALTAADRLARDPQHLAELVEQVTDEDPLARATALHELKAAKLDAVTALLAALAKQDQPEKRRRLQHALVGLGSISMGPLFGALEAKLPHVRAHAMLALAKLESRRATLFVAAPAVSAQNEQVRRAARRAVFELLDGIPTRQAVAEATFSKVRAYLSGTRPYTPDFEGNVTLWHWDQEQNRSVRQEYPADDAAIVVAAALSRNLSELAPDHPEYRRLFLVTQLEAAKLRHGYDQPLPSGSGSARQMAASEGAAAVEAALRYALASDLVGAAAAAAEVLGDIADASILLGAGGHPSPLAEAAGHADRRVRFAAVGAIMKIDPQRPYPGSSNVTDTLAYLARTTGVRRAIVGHPRLGHGQDLAGLLASLDYDVEVAATGRDLFRLATRSPDVQLLFVHPDIGRPGLRETLYSLRKHAHTARLPVGILAPLDQNAQIESLARNLPLAMSMATPHRTEAMQKLVDRLRGLAGRRLPSEEETTGQALQAMQWVVDLASKEQLIYDLRPIAPALQPALHLPALGETAADALGELGTASSQKSLVDVVSQRTAALEIRKAAAEAFARSVQEHGILLTTDQIDLQYERYNASATADRVTQQLLGYLLDVIEFPSKQQARLEQARR